jgi:HEAT repeat protein
MYIGFLAQASLWLPASSYCEGNNMPELIPVPTKPIPVLPLTGSETTPLRQHILALTEPQSASPEQAVLYGLTTEPLYLSIATAQRLLSLNAQGQPMRQNTSGNSVVTRIGDVFYKFDPTAPSIEYAVHTLHEALLPGLSTPTQLLIVRLKNTTYTVQASLAVEGVSFEALLWLAPGLARLETVMGRAALQQYIAHPPFLDETLSLFQQYQRLSDWLLDVSPEYYPLEFAGWQKKTPVQREHILQDAQAVTRGQSLLRLLPLLEQYPALAENMHWQELLQLVNVFDTLPQVFPKASATMILAEVPYLLDKIDQEQFSAHILATVLTQPQDGKADNYIAQLTWDISGRVESIRLVSIDNDAAFVQPIVLTPRKTQHEIDVKSVLYTLTTVLQQPVTQSVRATLLRYTSKIWLLRWLQGLYHYQQFYQSLRLPAHFYQLLLRPHDIVRLLEQFTTLQTLLREQPKLSLASLVEKIEPLLARTYQALIKQHASPLEIMAALYNTRQPVLLETLFELELDKALNSTQVLTLREALALEIYSRTQDKQRTGSILEAIHYLLDRIPLELSSDDQFLLWQCIGQLVECQVTLPLRQSYWLDDAVLAELYEQHPQAALAVLKNYPHLRLRLAKKGLIALNVDDPLLLHHILPVANSYLALLEVLLAAGANVNGRNPTNDGYTPLHLAARNNLHTVIPLLIAAGADIEAKLSAQGQEATPLDKATPLDEATPLDKAIKYENFEASRCLIQHGAGRCLQLHRGLKFLEDYQLTELQLCQQLLRNSPRLTWQVTLFALTQSSAPSDFHKRVMIAGLGKDTVRYLTTVAYDQLFKNREKITQENYFGRHAVTRITTEAYGMRFSAHIKENPELPGREVMVSTLAEQLFGQGIPQVTLLSLAKEQGIFFKDKITYPALASRTVGSGYWQDDNLASILAHHPEWLRHLDAQSFSEAVIIAMLTNPEDGKADNYVLESFVREGETRYRIVGVDNDHAFVRPFAAKKEEGQQSQLQVKTILYCFDTMQAPIHPKTRQRLLELDMYAFLQQWLETLAKREEQHETLFGILKEQRETIQRAVRIAFRPSIVRDLYQKLTRLQVALRRHPQLTHFELLQRVIPELGICYFTAFQRNDNPQARFGQLTEALYERVDREGTTHHRTLTNAIQVIQMTQDWNEPSEPDTDLLVAWQQLITIHQLQSQLRIIRDEVQIGNLERFLKLPVDHQAAIINGQGTELPGIDFSAMTLVDGKPDVERQRWVLNALHNIPLRTLRIHGCNVLSDQDIGLCLETSPELRVLSLSVCPRLTDEVLYLVADLCPQLEKLKLSQLDGLRRPGNRTDLPRKRLSNLPRNNTTQPVTLLALRELQVERCSSLTAFKLNTPKLERLYAIHCPQLSEVATASQQLKMVDLRGCGALTDTSIPPIAATWERATRVKVSASLRTQQWRERYPALNNLLWQPYNENFLARLEQGINQTLKERHLILTPAMGLQLKPLLQTFLDNYNVIPALLVALQDKDTDVRRVAAGALSAAIPLMPEKMIPALLAALQDESWSVRRVAAGALVTAIPLVPEKIVPALLTALQDKDRGVRRVAAGALVMAIPLVPEKMIPALLTALEDKDRDVRQAAAGALATAIPLAPEKMISALLKALQDEDGMVRQAAAGALATAIPLAPEKMIPVLLKALQDEDGGVRQVATGALAMAIPLALDEMIPTLLKALQDKDVDVRRAAAGALAATIPLAPEKMIFALFMALQDKNDRVRQTATDALATAISLSSEKMIPALFTALHDKNDGVRQAAINALTTAIPLAPKKMIPTLLKALQDEDGEIRLAAAGALVTAIPLAPEKMIPALLKALQDKNWQVRQAAAGALATAIPLAPEKMIPALLSVLNDGDWDVRQAAASALATVIPLVASEEVIPALLKTLKDGNLGVRLAAASALSTTFALQAADFARLVHQVLDKAGYPVSPSIISNLTTLDGRPSADSLNTAKQADASLPASSSCHPSLANSNSLSVIKQGLIWYFTETKVNHDGWCAVNAICQGGIQITGETFIAELKAQLGVKTVQQLVHLSLRSYLENTAASASEPIEFQRVRAELATLGLVEEQRVALQQKANTALGHVAGNSLTIAALLRELRVAKYHASLRTAEGQWQVAQDALNNALQQASFIYLDFIAKDRYADENLLRAYLFTQERCLGVVVDYGQGRTTLSQGLEIVNQTNWPTLYVVYRPGQQERTATYDALTLLQGPVPLLSTAVITPSVNAIPEEDDSTQPESPPIQVPVLDGLNYQVSQTTVSRQPLAQLSKQLPSATREFALSSVSTPVAVAEIKDTAATRLTRLQCEKVFMEFLKNNECDFKERQIKAPTCFISYTWETDTKATKALQARLLQLQKDLQVLGVKVYLDITHIDGEMGHYMREGILESDYVLLIGTPSLKQHLENPATNIALEWHYIQAKCQTNPKALIPLLFAGDFDTAFPPGVKQFLIRDFRNREDYYQRMTQLVDPLGLIPSLYGLHKGEESSRLYEPLLELFERKIGEAEQISTTEASSTVPPTPSSPKPAPATISAATLIQQHSVLYSSPPPQPLPSSTTFFSTRRDSRY